MKNDNAESWASYILEVFPVEHFWSFVFCVDLNCFLTNNPVKEVKKMTPDYLEQDSSWISWAADRTRNIQKLFFMGEWENWWKDFN